MTETKGSYIDAGRTANDESLLLTPAEKEAVDALRASLEDLIETDPMAKEHSDDYTLWRFWVARNKDIGRAKQMFEGTMEWRKAVGIDDLWEAKRVRGERNQADLCIYSGLSGTSKDGGCVIVERLGRVDARGLSENRPVFEDFLESYSVFLERAFRQVRSTKNKTRAVTIVDLEGLNRSHLKNLSIIKEIASIGPPNYPEVTSSVYMVRAPWIATLGWKLIKPLLPRETAAKVRILGSSGFYEDLKEAIPEENIPAFLGGKSTTVDGDLHDDFESLAQACPPHTGTVTIG